MLLSCYRLLPFLLLFPSWFVVFSRSNNIIVGTLQGKQETNDLIETSSLNHHSAPALSQLNETDILREHGPEPLSYWDHDFDEANTQWRGLMGLHVVGMCFSFFFLLPIGIVLRTVQHPWHGFAVLSFGVVAFLSSAAGSLYKKLTGNLYPGAVHGSHGFLVLGLFLILACCDALGLLRRASFFFGSKDKSIRVFWKIVIWNQQDNTLSEYTSIMHEDTVEHTEARPTNRQEGFLKSPLHVESGGRFSTSRPNSWDPLALEDDTSAVFGNPPKDDPRDSHAASSPVDTTFYTRYPTPHESRGSSNYDSPRSWLVIVGRVIFALAERSLLLLGLAQAMSGAAIYTGICRQNWLAVCIGHMVEGGVTVCYGLFTFARYLGLWSNLGWAWNRSPARSRARTVLSAEAVECVFFLFYGIMITFTERVGKKAGPLTTAKLQHLSIAVMLWISGMLGFALESNTLRWWISLPARASAAPGERIIDPPSYSRSFNPFPALVVGVIGVSFYYHPQKYIFAVNLHNLWGHLLVGFAVLRCLTYFFLWLRPPNSLLPSRPPTEALASFSLTCGGILFILSADQIYSAAMRRGHDDVMLFLSFAVAVTYLAFFWVLSFTAFKGWMTSRATQNPSPSR